MVFSTKKKWIAEARYEATKKRINKNAKEKTDSAILECDGI